MTEPVTRNTQAAVSIVLDAAVAAGVIAGLITGLAIGLSPFAAIAVGVGVAVVVVGGWIMLTLFKRVAQLEADHRTLREQLPEHLAQHEASIEQLHGEEAAVRERIERLELRLVRPDLRELTDLATEQGWEWWRGSEVVRFASPAGIELTFELPVEDGDRRMEIAKQLEGFGLRWSGPRTRIEASQIDRAPR